LNPFWTAPNSFSTEAVWLGKIGGAAWGGVLVPMLLQGECGYENL